MKMMKRILKLLLLAAWSALMVRYSKEVTEGVRGALSRCISVVIPSLFAFMAAADMLMRGGAYIYLSKPLVPLSKLIALPKELGSTFLLSNLAGYPAGAAAVSALYDEGALDKKSASRLLCTCYNGGPAFFAGAVGYAVFSSERTGLLIYLSIFAANILLAAVLNRIFPIAPPKKTPRTEERERGGLLVESVSSAGNALFKACGMILLFASFHAIAKAVTGGGLERLFGKSGTAVAEAFLEISELADIEGRPYRLLPVICAAGAFGGVCVLLQVKAIVGGRFSLLPFTAARVICAPVAAAVSVPLFGHFGEKAAPAAAAAVPVVNFNNFLPSVCLIMMIFLTILRKRLAFSHKI